ncbi:ATP-binding cassette domain-containing protein [candidate division KSB1 bacterium]|nr:ATP-binding cassette domain-containing protein [candidate division KSB1 bacterium]
MMSFFKLMRFLLRESSELRMQFFVYIIIAGLSQTLLLVIINDATAQAIQGTVRMQVFLLFITTLLLYVLAQNFLMRRFMNIVENIKEKIRNRLAGKIREADCYKLEKLNTSEIYATIVKETAYITQMSPRFISGIQCFVMLVCTMIYIAWLSPIAFLLVASAITFQIVYMFISDKKTWVAFEKSNEAEVDLLTGLTNVLHGFKQIKLSQKKGDSVLADVSETASRDRSLKITALEKYLGNFVMMLVFFYLLIGLLLFVLNSFSATLTPVLIKLITSILFLADPLWGLIELSTKMVQISVSVDTIYHLEKKLDAVSDGIDKNDEYAIQPDFRTIKFKDVVFNHRDYDNETTFQVGPVNMEINRGEVTFIVGGNGSGKSTFIKLLTALYFPDSGQMQVDDMVLTKENVQSYREMFAIILTDFHLFDKMHGINNVYPGMVQQLLRTFGLENKTAYKGNRFTNLSLSTGQRSRLAMIIAYLEDKDIYVFDEWAADQDSNFRSYFYEHMLTDLKARGKTVIAVTHDNDYFHVADRVFTMEMGQFVDKSPELIAEERRRRQRVTEVNGGPDVWHTTKYKLVTPTK